MYHITSDPLLIGKWDICVSSQPQIACIPSFETRRGRDEVETRSKHLKTLPKNQTCLILKTRSRRAQDASRRSWGICSPRRPAHDAIKMLAYLARRERVFAVCASWARREGRLTHRPVCWGLSRLGPHFAFEAGPSSSTECGWFCHGAALCFVLGPLPPSSESPVVNRRQTAGSPSAPMDCK